MEKLSLSQIGLYNAQRMSDDVVEKLFVVRQNLFELVLNKILAEPLDSIAQNHLFIGQRGMGKSTLLKRLEVELRTTHNKNFIPLLFPEEQYNIDKLADFWLNCLDAMADTLEVEKNKTNATAIDQNIKELEKVDKTEVDRLAFERLTEMSKKLGRRSVLLVDNLGLVFNRLEIADKHLLRAQLMKNGAPILIGSNPVSIDETNEYGAPFYDWFSFYHLKKLSFEELKSILINLAKLTELENLIKEINQHQARLQTLHQLTGGNPRTTVMLFKLIINGFTSDVNDDLEALLDEITPLYKARFEELPEKMQIIVDAIALAWHPVDLAKLRELTSLENQQLSPQIKRLVDLGWIEKVETDQKSSNSYQISERFFNIWFLMRRSSRRQKLQLYYLSRFLETLYKKAIYVTRDLKPKQSPEDSYYLNQSLFEVYENNLGLATQSLNQALSFVDDELPAHTQDDWWRFAAVVYKQKQTTWLLQCLEESGYHQQLAPFYYANKALLAENRKGYLGSLAAEIKLVTEMVLERIEHFLND